ncbi:DUF423 domain-containing protein [Arenibacter sp. GZD96]|uniref:DUF423 domain-containing protein n=1 Tax=Aurantibrevibacter litoralis TaxID=3106030 RepID=UPI002AFFAA6D|nr:DUF423 domain-containing protein [Arenibacter sp. GZD-96]MEA1787173.1 DUF423 domain-containing protein [Arenibacter sp. GZD-96]
MKRTILMTGTYFGLLAVVLGAFGAHTLGTLVDATSVNTFDTGVRYQMYHALFLLFLGSTSQFSDASKKWIFYFITAGVVLFSGSIYVLATNSLTAFNFKSIGFVTPIGGSLLILGWILLLHRCYRAFLDT